MDFKKNGMKPIAATFATAAMLGSLAVPNVNVAEASAKGRKNTAVGLGAAAAHQILTGKTTNGVLLGAGAAYSYKRYQDAKKEEDARKRAAQYRSNTSTTYRSASAYGGASARPGTRTTRPAARTTRTTTTTRYVPPQTSTTKVTSGTFIFTGPITRRSMTDDSITVNHNGILRPAFLSTSAIVERDGDIIGLDDLRTGETVRVTATQVSPNEWRASRITVVEPIVTTSRVTPVNRDVVIDDEDRIIRQERRETRRIERRERVGAANRPVRTTRIRDIDEIVGSRYTGVGFIEDVDESEGRFKIKVGQNTRMVLAEEARYTGVSNLDDLRKGDRVRVTGDIHGRDVFADRVEMLD